MNPPVDAPASRARRPRDVDAGSASSAAASFSPPRDTNRGGVADELDRLVGAHQPGRPRSRGCPPPRTRPAAIASTA